MLKAVLEVGMFLCGYESWTVDSGLEKRTRVFENNCHIGLLWLHYTTHTPNVKIHRIVTEHLGNHDAVLEIVKRIVIWFGDNGACGASQLRFKKYKLKSEKTLNIYRGLYKKVTIKQNTVQMV